MSTEYTILDEFISADGLRTVEEGQEERKPHILRPLKDERAGMQLGELPHDQDLVIKCRRYNLVATRHEHQNGKHYIVRTYKEKLDQSPYSLEPSGTADQLFQAIETIRKALRPMEPTSTGEQGGK